MARLCLSYASAPDNEDGDPRCGGMEYQTRPYRHTDEDLCAQPTGTPSRFGGSGHGDGLGHCHGDTDSDRAPNPQTTCNPYAKAQRYSSAHSNVDT
jgi:hypothetical protein